jgi:hypothetical protein
MKISQYIIIYNPFLQGLQYTLNTKTLPMMMTDSPVPGREGNIAIFGKSGKLSDSGFYLNEEGQVTKIEGGYIA